MACFGLGEEDDRAAITQLPRKYHGIRTCRYEFETGRVYDDKSFCLQIRKKVHYHFKVGPPMQGANESHAN